jgi:hypothetical protein
MLGKGRAGGKEIAVAITPSVRAILWPLRGQHPTRVFTFEAQRTADKVIRILPVKAALLSARVCEVT